MTYLKTAITAAIGAAALAGCAGEGAAGSGGEVQADDGKHAKAPATPQGMYDYVNCISISKP